MGEHTLNPVVGETNDSRVNNMCADPIQKEEVYAALNSASSGPVEEGSVGAGPGTEAFGWKGGALSINGAPVGRELGRYAYRDFLASVVDTDKEDGSIMIVVATDAPLTARNLDRVAQRAMMGLARTSSFASNGSGDYVIAFSTHPNARKPRVSEVPVSVQVLVNEAMTPLFAATAEAAEESIYNAIFKATTVRSSRGELRAIPLEDLMHVLEDYQSLNWDQTIGR